MKHSTIKTLTVFLMGIFLLASCTSTKKVIYLNDLNPADSSAYREALNSFESKIQKNDQLWITVGGSNAADLSALNSGVGIVAGANVGMGAAGNNAIMGYFVESDGTIKLPYLGKITVEGLTRIELEKKLADMFTEYTRNPVVNVRFLNYFYSVLGEVAAPGRVNMPNERATILEAISQAGDITYLGRSDNILVIREENGERTIGRVNLLSKDIFKSPYFYLKNKDVIYVEPVKSKFISRAGVPQYVSLTAVGLSLILTIINLRK